MNPCESDIKKITQCIRDDLLVNNMMTVILFTAYDSLVSKAVVLVHRVVEPDGWNSEGWRWPFIQILQKLYSVMFKQRYFKMLLSYHQFLLERDVRED